MLCAAVATSALACSDDADRVAVGALEACSVVAAGDGWQSQAFVAQAGRFHVELDATPSVGAADAVVGLGAGATTAFSQLAAIVRFNASGTIDARDGGGYRADVVRGYAAGATYHLRIDVDTRGHRYSAWLRNSFGGYDLIARDYAFRTEQASVAALDHVASEVDAAGSLEVCGFFMIPDTTTADGCVIADAGAGMLWFALPTATGLDTATFTATASGPAVDAVIGLSSGFPTSFTSLATAVRFAPNGMLDARDGAAYRADAFEPYSTAPIAVRMIADLSSHTYSVFEGGPPFARELARGYRFRTEQAGVTKLDFLGMIVDGTEGSVTVCQPGAAPSRNVGYSREGSYAVVPRVDGALISDGLTTQRLDASGRTVAQLGEGGELAGAAGTFVLAQDTSDGVVVHAYRDDFTAIYQDAVPVAQGSVVRSVALDATGAASVGLVSQQATLATALRLGATGQLLSQFTASGEAIVLDGGEPIVAWNDAGTLRVTRFTATGATRWARAFTGRAEITAMAVTPDHTVVFGGELQTVIDFGGGPLPLRSSENGPSNGFVAALTATGGHAFSRRTGYTQVGGLAANATRIAVSSTERTQFLYHHLQILDLTGAELATSFELGFGEHGEGHRVAIDGANRIWWNVETIWPRFNAWPYLVAIAP